MLSGLPDIPLLPRRAGLLIDLECLAGVPEIPEMHDRLLAIAAKRLGAIIVTCDPIIQASTQVRSIW